MLKCLRGQAGHKCRNPASVIATEGSQRRQKEDGAPQLRKSVFIHPFLPACQPEHVLRPDSAAWLQIVDRWFKGSGSQPRVVPRPVASASLGDLLETHILWPHPRPTASESGGGGEVAPSSYVLKGPFCNFDAYSS